VLGSATTDAGGYYRFDNLPAGTYVVVIDVPGSPSLANLLSSPGVADPESGVDRDDNGKDGVLPAGSVCAGGIASGPVTLGPSANEPLLEADKSSVTDVQTDPYSNLTVDFGFRSPIVPLPTVPTTLAPPTPTVTAPAVTTPNPSPTIAPSSAPVPSTIAPTTLAPTSVAPTTVSPTTVAVPAPSTAPVVVAVDPNPDEAEVDANIAFTGSDDDQLILLSLLMIGAGLALWMLGGTAQPAGATSSRSRRQARAARR
jgi:hypothetical protein